MKTALQIEGLKVGFTKPDKVLVKAFSEEVGRGCLVSLLGLNGSGKTTLLRTLVGREAALSGTVRLNGKIVTERSVKELAKLVAVVMTERSVPGLMLAEDVVALGRAPYTGFLGRLNAHDQKHVQEAMGFTGAQHLWGRAMGELSDGEKQKVLLARAVAQDTPLIILDEPNTYLDLKNRVMVFRQLVELSRRANKTVILSTHDLQLALQMSSRLWLIDESANIHCGSPKELVRSNVLPQIFDDQYIEFDKLNLSFNIRNV